MTDEQEFIHDLVNKMTMAHGKINRIISKSDKFTKQEIVEIAVKVKGELDLAFEIINARRNDLS